MLDARDVKLPRVASDGGQSAIDTAGRRKILDDEARTSNKTRDRMIRMIALRNWQERLRVLSSRQLVPALLDTS
jgi:hypothetical protein